MKIDLSDGKYTYVRNEDASQHALRYGEPWRDLTGDGFILAMAQKIEELETDISFLQSCVNSGEYAEVKDRPSNRKNKRD
jgi:hypothetical protein